MAVSAAAAAAAASSLSLSSTISRRRLISSSFSSSSATYFASSRSLFFTDTTVNWASLGLFAKARTNIKYGDETSKRSRRRGLSCNCMFGLGVPELVVIAGVAVLVFGPKKLPEVGRSFGKTIKGFQEAAKEFQSELEKESGTAAMPPTAQKFTANTGEEKQNTLAEAEEEKQDGNITSRKEN